MKIAIIISQIDFRDEEYFLPKSIFENAGFEVITIGEKKGQALGVYGGTTKIEKEIGEISADDFEAIVFVGGEGAAKNINNKAFHQIAQDFNAKGKIVAAICVAPAILATSGILQGKKATVFATELEQSGVKILKQNGAEYLKEKVVVDGNIITSPGPEFARRFAETIVKALQK